MKFRLLEDLESDLQQEAAEKDTLRKEVADIFKGTDFKEKKNINGISYNASYNGIEASFYIDDAVSYNGYVYDGADYNLQVEGDMKTVVDSAKNVLDEYRGLLDSADFEEEEVAEEESEEVETKVVEESFNDLVSEARRLRTEEELKAFIKKIEDDESISDKRYEALRRLALDSQYKNSSN